MAVADSGSPADRHPAPERIWVARTVPATVPTGRNVVKFVLTFLGVVALHAAWDSGSGLLWYAALGLISLAWLGWELHRTRALYPIPAREPVVRRRPGLI